MMTLIKELKEKSGWLFTLTLQEHVDIIRQNHQFPGSSELTQGWGLTDYRSLVIKHQGENIKIVQTADERQIVPLLLKALMDDDKIIND